MSEPTEPGSSAEFEPTEPDMISPEDSTTGEVSPATEPEAPAREPVNRQALFIAAALVVTLALGGSLYFVFRGDGDSSGSGTNNSAKSQAEAAVVGVLQGYDRVASRDESGCQMIADNIILSPDEANFVTDCVEATSAAGEDSPLKIEKITATTIDLDEAAGTGKVTVDVTTKVDGASETKSATLPVRKVDGRWKVDPVAV